jgi:uncharacterized protein (DUF305 family)
MKRLARTSAAAVIWFSATGAALAQGHAGHGAAATGRTDIAAMQRMIQEMMPADSDPASTKGFKQADLDMMRNMHVPFTGDADVDFRARMIPHHQGAIDMARVAIQYAKDPETKKLAQKIIDDQEKEIAEMREWLKKRGK